MTLREVYDWLQGLEHREFLRRAGPPLVELRSYGPPADPAVTLRIGAIRAEIIDIMLARIMAPTHVTQACRPQSPSSASPKP